MRAMWPTNCCTVRPIAIGSAVSAVPTIWGGRCMPYDAIDFESRDYVPHSGWPFGLDELMPYYPEANRLCEAGRFAYRADEAFPQPLPPVIEGFTSEDFTDDTL